MNILFLRGVNDDNLVEPYLVGDGGIAYRISGSTGVFSHMYAEHRSAESIVLFGRKVEQKRIGVTRKPDLVFNEISDPDSHRDALLRCKVLCSGIKAPIINHPAAIENTTRDAIARELRDIEGLTVPRTIRCQPRSPDDVFAILEREGLRLPAILRTAGQHGGKTTSLISSSDDRERLHIYPFDGRDFYLTQFVDYRDADGLFRKYRIVVISGKAYFRHVLISDEWMIHAASQAFSRERADLLSEMQRRRQTFDEEVAPRIERAVKEIYRAIRLDYFGMDCHISDTGQILVFEVNANMNVLHDPGGVLKEPVEKIKQAIDRLIRAKADSN